MRTLVLGGTRSGKSGYAEELVSAASRVSYVATARSRAGDAEWDARLAAHRRRRPRHWHTLECGENPRALPQLLRDAAPEDTLLVDDLGGWVTALYDAAGWDSPLAEPAGELASAVAACQGRAVLVSPEVGLSVVPDNRAARRFADTLGAVNRAVADACSGVVLVVAGQPLWIKGGAAASVG